MLVASSPLTPTAGHASPAAVPASTIDELHALGYLGAADAGSATNAPEPSMLPDPKDKIEEQNLLHAALTAVEGEEPNKARAALEKLLLMDEKPATALAQLGHLEFSAGNYKEAAEYFRRAREFRPDDAGIALDYARALKMNNDPNGARNVLQASLTANPHQFAARLLLGQIYFRLGDADAATDQLESAALLQPENVEARTSLGKVLLTQKKFADVVELLEPLAQSSPKEADVFALLGQAYAGVGRRQDARRAESQAQALRRLKK
jgi:predicted Zn-dependent protease